MNLVKLIEFLRLRLKTVVLACYGVLGLLLVVDVFFVNREHIRAEVEHLPACKSVFDAIFCTLVKLEQFPAFWSVFGFIACALIIILSKWYGHAGIMQREDYYDRPEREERK